MQTEAFPSSPVEFARSELFQRTFSEGMALVEEAAEFLEGRGRDLAKSLSRDGALSYAAQSMRLTTRLMQAASWLLVYRAVREGEMTPEEARAERYRLVHEEAENSAQSVMDQSELPETLTGLMSRCEGLYARLVRLDERLNNRNQSQPAGHNPVGLQLAKLEAALSMRG